MKRAEVVIDKSADEVWTKIGTYVDVRWIPNTETSRLDGKLRYVKMKGAASEVAQELLHHDDAARTYSYRLATKIDFGPDREFTGLKATIAVEPRGDAASRVTFDVETDEFLAGGVNREYQSTLDKLKADMEG
jgi:hypothetical protein